MLDLVDRLQRTRTRWRRANERRFCKQSSQNVDLRAMGYNERVLNAVLHLTKVEKTPYLDNIERIAASGDKSLNFALYSVSGVPESSTWAIRSSASRASASWPIVASRSQH
jgi:hypothetical protein